MPNRQKLEHAFRQGLGLDEDYIVEDLEYRSIPEWDSIAHMALVAEIEDAFDVMLPTDDVIALSSYKVCIEILNKHGVTEIS